MTVPPPGRRVTITTVGGLTITDKVLSYRKGVVTLGSGRVRAHRIKRWAFA